jgi:DNA-directed RNA polymerase subunit RPC12/RpoP
LPALSENIQLSDDATRCPQCGKRVTADDSVCAACGFELVAHRTRIRCSHCGSRIPVDSVQCPRCGADPHASRIPRAARIGALVLAFMLLVCIAWVIFRAITTNVFGRALGLNELVQTPTQFIQVINVVATTARSTPSPTQNPTATPSARFSPTPTRRGALTATPMPTTPTPVQGFYSAPLLSAPANATVYTNGPQAIITLQWQPVSPNGLRESEWYHITLTYVARDGAPGLRNGWSKETHFDVKGEWWGDAAADARTWKWNVAVMRIDGADPLLSPSKTLASPISATRTFFWN